MTESKKFLYVRFPEKYNGGVQVYALNFFSLLKKYGLCSVELIDLQEVLDEAQKKNCLKSMVDYESMFFFLSEIGVLDNLDGVISDIGLLEHREFFFVQYLKKRLPRLVTFLTIHDAPLTVINLFPFFELLQQYRFFCGVRKIVNFLFGKYIEKLFFNQSHNLIVLTPLAQKKLKAKLTFLGYKNVEVYLAKHPHLSDFEGVLSTNIKFSNRIVIGYLGYVSYFKGIDLLITTLGNIKISRPDALKNLTVFIAGGSVSKDDECYYASLVRLTSKFNLQDTVHFLGFLDGSKVSDYIRSLDLLILPYRKNGSGSASGPFMWARTFGIPVMASKTRNFIDEINHLRDGILFDDDVIGEGMEFYLLEYLLNYRLRIQLQEIAKEVSVDSSWKNVAHNFWELVKAKLVLVKRS